MDDENPGYAKEEGLATDKDVSHERENEPMGEEDDDLSIVTSDHESEARRSQTGEDAEEIDNGSDLESEGWQQEDSEE